MKKRFLVIGMLCGVLLSGCGNYDEIDTVRTYDKAIIKLGDEYVEIEIAKWRDYEDGEQIQIIAEDGTVYLTSSYNCTLIRE